MDTVRLPADRPLIQYDTFGDEIAPVLVERAIALRPLLQSEAPTAERNRNMTDAVFEAVSKAELWRLLIPRRWGGHGLSATAASCVYREIAKGDPAAAWVVQILNGTGWIASIASDAIQEEIFADGPPMVCSSFAAAGTAVPVDGGFRVSGLWPYSSGSRQAKWGQFLVNIPKPEGGVRPGNFIYFKMADAEIVDTWFSAGMQGTSSDSVRMTDVFVPEHRMVYMEKSFGSGRDTQKYVSEPSDFWPQMQLIRGVGLGLQIGAAEAALALAIEIAKTKGVASTSYARQADSSVIQRDLGAAAVKIQAAKVIADGVMGLFDQAGINRQLPDVAARARNKGEVSLVIELCREAMTAIMNNAGSSAFMLDNMLQRYWRDTNVSGRHAIYNANVGYEIFGRNLLGVEPNIAPPNLI